MDEEKKPQAWSPVPDMPEEKKEGANDEEPQKWKGLFYDYTQDTTMHGIRYVTLATKYYARRIVWALLMLGALALFIYVVQYKLKFLLSDPKTVNVDVTFRDDLPFPKVTFCNENKYRMTRLFNQGLYDLMVTTKTIDNQTDVNYEGKLQSDCKEDEYVFYPDVHICEIPKGMTYTAEYITRFARVARATCVQLCSSAMFGEHCSGFLYDREDLSCTLSPYTATHVTPDQECARNNTEFYRRLRCLKFSDTSCNSEDDLCAFEDEPPDDRADQWITSTANNVIGKKLIPDNTLNSLRGHYLELTSTRRRPGYSARLVMDYIRTDGLCLVLFYRGTGQISASLEVRVRDEEMRETRLYTIINPSIRDDWSRVRVELPDGINQVLILGTRSHATVTSGLLLDDIEVTKCSGLVRSCMQTMQGKDYVGIQDQAYSGGKCLPWSRVLLLGNARYDLPEVQLSGPDPFRAAGSYCRNIPALGWQGPMCYTEDFPGSPTSCNIQYCECPTKNWFKCSDNNACIPESQSCDGIRNCDDGSDETEGCDERLDVQCDFEEPFMCGYTVLQMGEQAQGSWIRHKGPGYSGKYSPQSDYHGSTSGYYMLIDSRQFNKGNKFRMISPLWEFTGTKKLRFRLFMNANKSDGMAAFKIYLADSKDFTMTRIFSRKATQNLGNAAWTSVTSNCLIPAGTSRVVLEATTGDRLMSDVGIDGIELIAGSGSKCQIQSVAATVHYECTPDSGNCESLEFLSNNAYFTWALDYESSVEDIKSPPVSSTCGQLKYTDAFGQFASPNYPGNYFNYLDCGYTIELPENSTITIEFTHFDVEEESSCSFDYLSYINYDDGTQIESAKFCGKTAPPKFTSTSNKLQIKFYTDNYLSKTGFNLKYTSVSTESLVYKAKYHGRSHDDDLTTLFNQATSPPFIANTSYCLEGQIMVKRPFEISLFRTSKKMSREVILNIKNELGNGWHMLKYIVNMEGENGLSAPDTFKLVFKASSPPVQIVSAGIKSFKVSSKDACSVPAFPEGEVFRCSFDDNTGNLMQCGLVDQTLSGPNRWIRNLVAEAEKSNNGKDSGPTYRMVLNLDAIDNEAVLSTPRLKVNPDECFAMGYRINSDFAQSDKSTTYRLDMSVLLKASDGSEQVIQRVLTHKSVSMIALTLPEGSNQILIRVVTHTWNNQYKTDDNYQLELDYINVVKCLDVEPMGVSCEFTNSFACGYEFGDDWYIDGGLRMIPYADEIHWVKTPTVNNTSPVRLDMTVTYGEGGAMGLYTWDGVMLELFSTASSVSDPQVTTTHSACLPAGELTLALMAFVPDSKSFLLNRITHTMDPCTPPVLSEDVSLLSCNFWEGTSCNYTFLRDNLGLEWNSTYDLEDNNPVTNVFEDTVAGKTNAALYSLRQGHSTNASLVSKVLTKQSHMCVTMEYANLVSVNVVVEGYGGTKIQRKELLNEAPMKSRSEDMQNYIALWNTIQFPINSSGLDTFQLIIKISANNSKIEDYFDQQTVFSLRSIQVIESASCKVPGTVSSLSCTFDKFANEVCGVIDNSIGTQRWLRKEDPAYPDNIMLQTTIVEVNRENRLESPLIISGVSLDEACITFKYAIENMAVKLDVVLEDANGVELVRFTVNEECNTAEQGWKSASLNVRPAFRRVAFEAYLEEFHPFGGWASLNDIKLAYNSTSCSAADMCSIGSKVNQDPPPNQPAVRIDIRSTKTSFDKGLQMVLHDKGNKSTAELWEELGHSKYDMVSECYWEGKECSVNDISQVFTDVGSCYSFNYDIIYPTTKYTGAENGLQLVINTEEFDHTLFYSTDAGIRVHAHSQQDEPNIKNLGFAVQPGSHTLVGMTYTETESLPEPYGPCTAIDLDFFPEHYSKNKCTKECLSKWIFGICGCVGPNDPGDYVKCSLREDLVCKQKLEQAKSRRTVIDNCNCPDNCTVVGHKLELSNSQISFLNADTLLSKHYSRISSRYAESLELRERVDSDILMPTIDAIELLLIQHEALEEYLRFNVTSTSTSIVSGVSTAAKAFVSSLESEVGGDLIKFISKINGDYLQYYDQAIEYFLSSLVDMQRGLGSYVDSFFYNGTDYEIIRKNALKMLDTSVQHAKDMKNLMKGYLDADNANGLLPKRSAIYGEENNRKCDDVTKEWSTMVDLMLDCIPTYDPLMDDDFTIIMNGSTTCIYTPEIKSEGDSDCLSELNGDDPFSGCARKFIAKSKQVSTCFRYYKSLIDRIGNFLTNFGIDNNLGDYSLDERFKTLRTQRGRLEELSLNYYGSNIDKANLVTTLLTGILGGIVQEMDSIYTQMQQELSSPIQTKLTSMENSLVTSLTQIYSDLSELYGFFRYTPGGKSKLETIARSANIWRHPQPNMRYPEELNYKLTKQQVSITWPEEQDINAFFLSGTGFLIIKQAVAEYFDELKASITDLMNDVKARKNNIETTIQEMQLSATKYIEKTAMDASFVRHNYLKLDMFYGELKYEKIIQQPAYEVVSFFSDVGGYMGLLLGGSLITLLEFLDLIIYNSFIKSMYKRNNRRVDSSSS